MRTATGERAGVDAVCRGRRAAEPGNAWSDSDWNAWDHGQRDGAATSGAPHQDGYLHAPGNISDLSGHLAMSFQGPGLRHTMGDRSRELVTA